MAHLFESGVFGNNQPAWHGLGTVVAGLMTSAECMRLAGMDYLNEKVTVDFQFGGSAHYVPDTYAVVRQDTGKCLGVVGKNYEVYQNWEMFDFTDSLISDGIMQYETAGVLDEGRKVWLLASMPNPIDVTPKDTVLPYVMLLSGHDGSSSVHLGPTGTRVVCANTYKLALDAGQRAGNIWTIKHTKKLQDNLRRAKTAFQQVHKLTEAVGEQWKELARTEIKRDAFKDYVIDIVDHTYPKKEVEVVVERPAPVTQGINLLDMVIDQHQTATIKEVEMREERSKAANNMLEAILRNYDKPTQTDTGAAGTAWAAYNAVTEYTNHGLSYHGAKGQPNDSLLKAEARMESVFTGRASAINDYAYSQVMKRFK